MTDNSGKAIHQYRVYIKATPQAVWDALTKPEWSVRYGYAPLVDYDLRAGGQFRAYPNEGIGDEAISEYPRHHHRWRSR